MSDVTKKFLKEEEETAKRTAQLHKENEEADIASAKANIDNGNTDKGIKVPKVDEKARKVRWEALVKAYAEVNPVKYASKKKAGQFDEPSATFK